MNAFFLVSSLKKLLSHITQRDQGLTAQNTSCNIIFVTHFMSVDSKVTQFKAAVYFLSTWLWSCHKTRSQMMSTHASWHCNELQYDIKWTLITVITDFSSSNIKLWCWHSEYLSVTFGEGTLLEAAAPCETLQHCGLFHLCKDILLSLYTQVNSTCSRYVCHNTASCALWASIRLSEPRLSLQSVFGLIRQTRWRGRRGTHAAKGRRSDANRAARGRLLIQLKQRPGLYSETWWWLG